MKPSFLSSSFLFFVVIANYSRATTSSSINESSSSVAITNPRTVAIKAPAFIMVTDRVIRQVCYNITSSYMNKHDFCHLTLENFIGKPLFPKPLISVMESTQNQAKRTTTKLWQLNDNYIIRDEMLKTRYNKCLKKYNDAIKMLDQATGFILDAKPSSVRIYTSMALRKVQSCNEKLAGYYGSHELAEDNRKFTEYANMVIAICTTLKPGKY